ncbi:hypothetical protein KC318_g280 [Hortaea werneckii]|nr:hypothetical protein KC334_g198 [Hortaea werneckii]KAI7027774.1 hypothetical protein KC355_g205 [Hortaea werneckii]KAI7676400.1 hypothetical protein KC318_g280 [Hortaea werneckii]
MATTNIPSLLRSTTGRAVHFRVTPRPSNMGESREMMRLLTRFGEVEYFKNLAYDAYPAPNTCLAIFREESAAQECLRRTPIRFRMTRVNTTTTTGPTTPADSSDMNDPSSSFSDPETRIFQLSANTARANFRDQIDSTEHHGSFKVDGKSAAQQDLARRVPLHGLSHVKWPVQDKPWKVIDRQRRLDEAFRGSGKRKGLGEIWREGEDARTG